MSTAQDPDDLYGDAVIFELQIKVRRNGAMSVAGHIENKDYALACLEAAKDSVRNHHARKQIETKGGVVIPANDAPTFTS